MRVLGAALLMAFALPTLVASQDGPRAPQPAPVDSGYAAWSRTNDANVPPRIASTGDLHAVFLPLSEQSRGWRAGRRRWLADSCAQRQALSSDLANELAERQPFAAYDSAAAAVPTLAITLIRARRAAAGCGDTTENVVALLADGVMHHAAGNDHPTRDIVDVEMRRNGDPLRPLLTAKSTAVVVSRTGVRDGTAMIRIYFPLSILEPDQNGKLPVIELRASQSVYATPEFITVPDTLVRALWNDQFTWRTARLAVADPSAAIVALPTPTDSLLLRSRELYREGNFSDASLLAIGRLARKRSIVNRDRVSAQVQLGLTFLSANEDVVASYFLTSALAVHPCLQFADGAPIAHRQLLDRNRPESACDTRPMRNLALVSLVPGGAQWTDPRGDKLRGGIVAGVAAALLTSSVVNRLSASSLHRQYLDEVMEPQALYERAESHRMAADRQMTLFAGVWAANWAWSVGRELMLRRRIRREGNYGAPTSTFAPVDATPNPSDR